MSDDLKVAIYGKGGIGKSVIATSLSARYAMMGRAVLHVGCDPKRDSAVRLMDDGLDVPTVLEVLGEDPTTMSTERVINEARLGIHCIESGGPPPGLGCGGRGVARTLEFLDEMEIMETGDYDVVIFDVLGDVVCGGFAAPLRQGFAEKVAIVMNEEPMALYAANNISKAIRTYERNGITLAGLIANLRGPEVDREMLESFADRLSTKILAYIPRDPLIMEAERFRKTVVEYAPESPSSTAFAKLADALEGLERASLSTPTPLEDKVFYDFLAEW